jgi:hypothetical protein
MSTTINRPIQIHYENRRSVRSLVNKFLSWCTDQEQNRLLWQCITVVVLGSILTPLTVLAVALSGRNLFLFLTALVAMEMPLVTNLAALPTKITIPVFLLGIVMDITVIVISVFLCA